MAALFNEERLGPCGSFRRALKELVDTGDDTVVVFQDDIAITPGLFPWILGVLPVVDGIVSLYTPNAQHAESPGWSVVRGITGRTPIGALAVLMSRTTALRYLSRQEPSGVRRPTTSSLAEFCRTTGTEWWVHSPSFVKHIGARSAIDSRSRMPALITPERNCREFCEDVACLR